MELKDLILETLHEIDEELQKDIKETEKIEKEIKEVEKNIPKPKSKTSTQNTKQKTPQPQPIQQNKDEELEFLYNLREKILVLFEGLQSPNITKLSQKLDLTINFLELLLATIEKRINAKK